MGIYEVDSFWPECTYVYQVKVSKISDFQHIMPRSVSSNQFVLTLYVQVIKGALSSANLNLTSHSPSLKDDMAVISWLLRNTFKKAELFSSHNQADLLFCFYQI